MAQGLNGANTCDGETIVVNRHGALIFSSVALRVGMKIEILLVLTNKRGAAEVVYVDPERPRVCAIRLLREQDSLWGVSFPPNDLVPR